MTGFAELEDAVEAINRGKVYRYLFKPWRSEELLQVFLATPAARINWKSKTRFCSRSFIS